MLIKSALYSTLAALLLGLTSYANAAQVRTDDGYVIHYNAFSTEILLQKTAETYGIKRSKNRAMLNVSVRKGEKGSLMNTKGVEAKVMGHAVNLSSQLKTLKIREVPDSGAVYYIAEFNITDKEILNFTIWVDPEAQGKVKTITFSQQFFID